MFRSESLKHFTKHHQCAQLISIVRAIDFGDWLLIDIVWKIGFGDILLIESVARTNGFGYCPLTGNARTIDLEGGLLMAIVQTTDFGDY